MKTWCEDDETFMKHIISQHALISCNLTGGTSSTCMLNTCIGINSRVVRHIYVWELVTTILHMHGDIKNSQLLLITTV